MAVRTPHFDLPFRLSGTSFAVVEQDSYTDVANCVETIIRTPFGYRDDTPQFGMDDTAFNLQPLNTEKLTAQITSQEPRATIHMDQIMSLIDELAVQLIVKVD